MAKNPPVPPKARVNHGDGVEAEISLEEGSVILWGCFSGAEALGT